MATLVLVRHGQASYLAADYDRLSTLGEAQARKVGDAVGVRPDRVFVGPRRRQQDTARLAARDDWPLAEELAELDEHHVGSLFPDHVPALVAASPKLAELAMAYASAEDRPSRERIADRLLRECLHAWRRELPAMGHLESYLAFRVRAKRALDRLLDAPRGTTTVAFSSGGLIAAIAGEVVGASPEQTIELGLVVRNAALSEIRFQEGRASLFSWNDVGHLATAERTFR